MFRLDKLELYAYLNQTKRYFVSDNFKQVL